jgi:hypothetical protein
MFSAALAMKNEEIAAWKVRSDAHYDLFSSTRDRLDKAEAEVKALEQINAMQKKNWLENFDAEVTERERAEAEVKALRGTCDRHMERHTKDALEIAALKAKAKVADEYYTGEATRSMAEEVARLRAALSNAADALHDLEMFRAEADAREALEKK